MTKEHLIEQTEDYVKKFLQGESSGHDWWHIYRVWKMAYKIAREEKDNDLFVIQIASLLHDIGDWKFNKGKEDIGQKLARIWLEKLNIEEKSIYHVCEIIKDISFKGAGVRTLMKTKEGMIVQDADRLDAIGAIGIARCFAYGGWKGVEIYNPELKPKIHKTFEEYKKAKTTSINHFYEKLLLLKTLMNTKTAKRIAEKRHKFMKRYLNKFFKEWDGKN